MFHDYDAFAPELPGNRENIAIIVVVVCEQMAVWLFGITFTRFQRIKRRFFNENTLI